MISIYDLPEPIKSKALEYYDNNPDKNKLAHLSGAFLWSTTSEGHAFWSSICSTPDNATRLKIWYDKYPSKTPLTDIVRRGAAVIENGDRELLKKVISVIFPDDPITPRGTCSYYRAAPNCEFWADCTDSEMKLNHYTIIPLNDIARELGLLDDEKQEAAPSEWEPKPGEVVELHADGKLSMVQYIGRRGKTWVVYHGDMLHKYLYDGWPSYLFRPVKSRVTVTRQEIAEWKGCTVEQLIIE